MFSFLKNLKEENIKKKEEEEKQQKRKEKIKNKMKQKVGVDNVRSRFLGESNSGVERKDQDSQIQQRNSKMSPYGVPGDKNSNFRRSASIANRNKTGQNFNQAQKDKGNNPNTPKPHFPNKL
jgi:hypothetical protein